MGPASEPRRYVGFVDVGPGADAARFHLKRYRYATWRESLGLIGRGTFWGTPPEIREFRALRALRGAGIPAVAPAAAAAITRFGRLVAHGLLTHAAPADARSLEARLRDPADPLLREAPIRRALCRALGDILRRMHALPFAHRDLRARNVLVAPGAGGIPRLWLLDCRRGGPGGFRDAVADLASLDRDLLGRVSRGDRMAALRAYLGPDGDPGPLVARIATYRASVSPPRAV